MRRVSRDLALTRTVTLDTISSAQYTILWRSRVTSTSTMLCDSIILSIEIRSQGLSRSDHKAATLYIGPYADSDNLPARFAQRLPRPTSLEERLWERQRVLPDPLARRPRKRAREKLAGRAAGRTQ